MVNRHAAAWRDRPAKALSGFPREAPGERSGFPAQARPDSGRQANDDAGEGNCRQGSSGQARIREPENLAGRPDCEQRANCRNARIDRRRGRRKRQRREADRPGQRGRLRERRQRLPPHAPGRPGRIDLQRGHNPGALERRRGKQRLHGRSERRRIVGRKSDSRRHFRLRRSRNVCARHGRLGELDPERHFQR